MTLTAMRDLLADDRTWTIAATVQKLPGQDSHFKKSNDQLLISVLTNTHAVPVWVIHGGGDLSGFGVWLIPSIGTEVMIAFSDGEFEGDAFLIGMFGRRDDVDDGVTLLCGNKVKIIAEDEVHVVADTVDVDANKVNFCGAAEGPLGEGVVVGTGIDSFTGSTYNVLGSSSSRVFIKK
jgi:hypothetical protein